MKSISVSVERHATVLSLVAHEGNYVTSSAVVMTSSADVITPSVVPITVILHSLRGEDMQDVECGQCRWLERQDHMGLCL